MRSSEEDDHERQYHRSSYLPGEGVICRECYKERNFNLRAVVSYGQSIDGSRRCSRYRASACFNGDRVVGEQIQCGRKNDQLTQRGSVGKIKGIPGRPSMTFKNRTWFFTNDSSSRDADLRYLRSNGNDVMEITVRQFE